MLRCLRLRGTSRAQILFDLCLLRGKNPLWLSNVSHSFFFPPWILFTDAAACLSVNGNDSGDAMHSFTPNNNTYFFHFMVFTDHGEEEQSKSTRSLWETLGFLYIHIYISVYIYIWFGLKFDVGLQLEPGASRKKFYFDLLVNSLGSMVSLRKRSCRNSARVQSLQWCNWCLIQKKHSETFAKLPKAAKSHGFDELSNNYPIVVWLWMDSYTSG